MKKLIIYLFFIFSVTLKAQFSVLSITPADGSVNTDQNTIIRVEFNETLDTIAGFNFFEDYFTNAFDQDSIWFSSDLKSVNIHVNLELNKNYYFMVYSATAQSGSKLSNQAVVYFTTDSVLTGNTVSGNVSAANNSGLDFSRTLVALSSTPVGEGEPMIEIGTFANSSGDFSIPNVKDGNYYPIAVNDANEDGRIDPGGGDAFSFLDMIVVSGNYNNLNFVLDIPDPLTLLTASEIADSLRQELFSENTYLKRISTWNTDSIGNASEWEFYLLSDSVNKVSRLRIDRFGHRLDNYFNEWEYQSLSNMDLIPNLNNSVDLEVFVANADADGGKNFREQDKPSNLEFSLELILADHRYSYLSDVNPDTSNHIMWAASYRWYEEVSEDNWEVESELTIFGDFESGDIILTDVYDKTTELPAEHTLLQNYPNPFNPATSISYSLAKREFVNISVYDILGNKIITLANGVKPAGKYDIKFNAEKFPSGTYFYQIKTKSFVSTKKMLLVK